MIIHFAADISFDASNSAKGILNIFYYLPKIQDTHGPKDSERETVYIFHIKKLPDNQNPV